VIALVLTAGALAWVGVLLAAPAMPEAGAAWLDAVGGIICHQLPERSFAIDGRQLPVCGRCLGLYAGAAAGALVAAAFFAWNDHRFADARTEATEAAEAEGTPVRSLAVGFSF
jgi:hypothetical protein